MHLQPQLLLLIIINFLPNNIKDFKYINNLHLEKI